MQMDADGLLRAHDWFCPFVFMPNAAIQRERRLSPRSAGMACWVLLGFDFTLGFLHCSLYHLKW
jgi:hypothetical protein